MFFMMGVTQEKKDLEHDQTMICDVCGSFGRYNVFVVYTVLTLFFLPVWKWNRHYYVEMSCCHSLYELNSETGRGIENGSVTAIDENGAVQFEPFKITDGAEGLSRGVSNGFFVANDGADCAVYDVYGNYIRHLCGGQDVSDMLMISGGYVLLQMSPAASGMGELALVLYRLNPEG